MQRFRMIAAAVAFSFTLTAAENPFIGTWKLNNSKSKFAPATETKEMRVVFEETGGQVKRVATGIDSDGEPIADTSVVAWDGQDHSIAAQPGMTVAVVRSGRTINVTIKREGKVVETGKLSISRNGKTMTAILKGSDERQRAVDNVEIFEKQ